MKAGVELAAGLVLAAAVASAGCAVGSGAGVAEGELFELGCGKLTGPGGQGTPVPYSLKPVFFAGEPIEAPTMTNPYPMNQLRIRMQDNGLAVQYADVLTFEVENSYEVGRCLRGRTVNGQPDWNVNETLPDGTPTWWCDWSATGFSDGGALDAGTVMPGGPDAAISLDGGVSMMATVPRIHLTPYTDLRASLATLSTCGITNVVGLANDGWIQFEYFGGAEEPNTPPDQRSAVPGNFVIQYGDRMRANFLLTLTDQAIIAAMEQNQPPPQMAQIGGWLQGYFDFNLERGRSAQPFP
ncbi:MAG TPA: hypothetical protein VMT03_01890 [Polyangia bacterium]|nr:hypothetical protein [Polyangia bacterium]